MPRTMLAAIAALAQLLCVMPAPAQVQASCSFTTFSPPAPYTGGTFPTGINRYGNVVGYVLVNAGTAYGFIRYSDGTWKVFMQPGAQDSYFFRRNDSGVTVGMFIDANGNTHGLVYYNGRSQTVDYPGATNTTLEGVNRYNVIVGIYDDSMGNHHGFKLKNGVFSAITVPGASNTLPTGINDYGVIDGYYYDSSNTLKGFVDQNGTFRTISDPFQNKTGTYLDDLNNSGALVGNYFYRANNGDSLQQGFIYRSGEFKIVTAPNASETHTEGINRNGAITGFTIANGAASSGYIAMCN